MKLKTSSLSKMTKKSLGSGGKAAIVAAAAIGVAILASNDDEEKPVKKEEQDSSLIQDLSQSSVMYNPYVDNSAQLAADMSSYKYGKHITGFVNF